MTFSFMSMFSCRLFLRFLFLATLIFSCSDTKDHEIIWQQDQAIAVSFSGRLIGEVQPDSVSNMVSVHLTGASIDQKLLGTWNTDRGRIVFHPAVPFSRGFTYELLRQNRPVVSFTVPADEGAAVPELLEIYPSSDTVPENLLKMYFHFSEPMNAGRSLRYISMVRNQSDTLNDIFLDLQPELWDADGSTLTLWLDPGRIKQGLIPNETLGNPLMENQTYTLTVSAGWLSRKGKRSIRSVARKIYVSGRDEQMPNPQSWNLSHPRNGSRDTLRIDFGERLDFMVLKSAIKLQDEEGTEIDAAAIPNQGERALLLVPNESWVTGKYAIMVDPKLEDLAGNNTERLFDRDMTAASAGRPVLRRTFEVP